MRFLQFTVAVTAALCLPACNVDRAQSPQLADQIAAAEIGPGAPASLVFHSNRDGNAEIYSMDSDGGSQTRLTVSAGNDLWPDISANGRYVAFASARTGNLEIFVLDLKNGDLANVSNSSADDNWPRWSPNGQQLAFHSNRSGNYEIYAVNFDGTGLRAVTNNPLLDQWPDWSPNGRRIAFRRGTDIYTIDANGVELDAVQLTSTPAVDQMAVWSPNGQQLAFMSLRDGYPSVFIMDADGETLERPAVNLTPKDPADAASTWLSRAPAWSVNGRQIYFMSFRPATAGDVELFVMDRDGGNVTRLTNTAGEDGGPQAR